MSYSSFCKRCVRISLAKLWACPAFLITFIYSSLLRKTEGYQLQQVDEEAANLLESDLGFEDSEEQKQPSKYDQEYWKNPLNNEVLEEERQSIKKKKPERAYGGRIDSDDEEDLWLKNFGTSKTSQKSQQPHIDLLS